MQQQRRRNRVLIGVLSLGLLAGVALTVGPAQAVDAVGPYYAEPAWDRKMPSANRFVVLTDWNSEAVLDKETGLVWERTLSSRTFIWNDNASSSAREHCVDNIRTGNRKGWRLPSIDELASLLNPSFNGRGPKLPLGHPFLAVQATSHWSATTDVGNPTLAWSVNFSNGVVGSTDKTLDLPIWCVRGGNNAEVY